ncbi:probabable haloacid dehalogenase-like hydrolase (plasmid) [Sinorhizobium meliloti SM11]|uniref:Probabable haloacid dehalogenase-like hydrolase n=1 Tax=Sinorhizobium meliloti (strain SM11) TaxID=707241 RepID=F7XDF8_SINMM|nr:probabable haloacid dehalogenase-like hydrolase [Sinorhizobium meliloti SM11]
MSILLPVKQESDMIRSGQRPEWLTFDCYGTLIQ